MAARTTVSESDDRLMARVRTDDTEAFEQLYERHAIAALRVAAAVCRDIGRAEDAVQEAFLRMWRGRLGYRASSGSFKSWALQIVRNQAIDATRREGARPTTAAMGEDKIDLTRLSIPAEVIARSEGASLRTSLRKLPEAQSTVITLAFFGELTHSEIAERLELPPGTVKGRMRLGMDKLRAELQDED